MLKTISKLFSKKASQPSAPPRSPEDQAAFDKGREISRAQTAEIEHFIGWRYEQIRTGYLDVIQKQIDSGRQQEEYSPLLVARVEYSLYLKHVQEAQDALKAEVYQNFTDWSEFSRELAVEDITDKWLDTVLSERFLDLRIDGLKVMTDNADILKTADDNWRRKFPDLAAAQPLD
ncbi:hypothetical protein [Rhizobium ruizarguesonis]|uniref:hypothetical protein n=1 Tax=Rhizobium ruizarguesonis TaxID=2081791 RepID=UPI00102F4528|nr:hypothetical protein [Rhizobium ruizarguesonis]TBE02293.1 hypothetical protein ELH10_15465 [Rhizobium ruizarguesonis]TBF14669.1 hypothetical protein ELG95_14610 [Rhizobium ruizarguesonis]